MPKLVPIRYIGRKSQYTDHLYGTGVTWGFSEDQPVPVTAAIKLLAHPEFEDARDDTSVPLKALLREPEPVEEIDENELGVPLANLDAMTKAQLLEHAQRYLGVALDASLKKADLVDAVRRATGRRPA